jgi:hypothetical protein
MINVGELLMTSMRIKEEERKKERRRRGGEKLIRDLALLR